jgi:excisionase family DNA binding protein
MEKSVPYQEARLVSIGETARRLGLKPVTVRLWAAQRKLARVKLGTRVLIPESEIERLIEANLTPARTERVTR